MIILKVFSAVLPACVSLIVLVIDKKWGDKRTKIYRWFLGTAITFIILSGIVNVWVIFDDHMNQKEYRDQVVSMNSTIDQLNKALLPFIDVARSRYPGLAEGDALDELRKGLYQPRDRLTAFVERIATEGVMSDSDATKLISLTRQMIESENQDLNYPIVTFYCDWDLSTGVNSSTSAFFMLNEITGVFLSDNGTTKVDVPLKVSELLSIQKFRSQLLDLYASRGIPTVLFETYENWNGIMKFLIRELIGKPVEYPVDSASRSDSAGVMYRELEKKATGHPMLMARRLWLSDEVKGKRKGDVYWYVQTMPRVMIYGRLLMVEQKSDFNAE